MKPNKLILFHAQQFREYEPPFGGLIKGNLACHALFRYYVMARSNWERMHTDIRYEHERQDVINYRQLIMSVATAYGTTPEIMVKFWKEVDFTCLMNKLPLLPDEERYRQNRTMEVRTQ